MFKHKKLREPEQRSVLCEVRTDNENEEKGVITGRPIVFNTWTDLGCFDEMISSHALDHTDLTDVRFLVNHDTSKVPLARSRRNNGNSTMQLLVDEQGLFIRARLDIENNADAAALYSAIERGDISGMSFMFWVRENGDEWSDLDSDHPRRIINDIEGIVEVSAVTFPAYDATSINARSQEALENARAALESVRVRSLDSDDNQLELEKAKARFKFKFYGGN